MYYKGIFGEKGVDIREEDSYDYAIERVKNNENEKKEFTEWFFSGNWVRDEDNKI